MQMLTERLYKFYGLGLNPTHIQRVVCHVDHAEDLHIVSESCFWVLTDKALEESHISVLEWILGKPECASSVSRESNLMDTKSTVRVHYGPRPEMTTAFSTNAVSACKAAGLAAVLRIEKSIRFAVSCKDGSEVDYESVKECLFDKMTQCLYPWENIEDNVFHMRTQRVDFTTIDIMNGGIQTMQEANLNLGLGFDDADLQYYTNMFAELVKRNPTDVELFDLAQSNSEHSRHWFFKGRILMDDLELQNSLFQMIMDTQQYSNNNNVIKFNDNSSAIVGYSVPCISLGQPDLPAPLRVSHQTRHIIFTAETHNFPTGVSPFPGAATGTGGRIRDVHATGRGAHEIAGTVGYSFGNLNIPGYELPWEVSKPHPNSFAKPVEIIVQASNGASDYGNKFGEPVICGFTRSYAGMSPNNQRIEYLKPIMFSGGIGCINAEHVKKAAPTPGMLVVKMGGPVYRIGVGGGSASSMHVQGGDSTVNKIDFNAVQRGDPQMEHKLHRAIRAAIEMGEHNPILCIHDQGAGGNGNVLKELVEGGGAIVECGAFQLGDESLSVRELWGAEYQESDAMLVAQENKTSMMKLCRRERCPVSFVGKVTGDNRMILKDYPDSTSAQDPVSFDLSQVLESMPRKIFELKRVESQLPALKLPADLTVADALSRVLRLPCVASKRYLTNKVDRSVTGLIAQQQCVGPLHTPLADYAVVALSYLHTRGAATSIGEQPIKGLVDPGAGARMTVGESLTNLVFAHISDIRDVKCSGNWMWAAKLEGEGIKLVEACMAMCDVMKQLGVAVDGGKDSLSMAARVGDEVVKAPGTLVVSTYAPCPDIRLKVTPDLKCTGQNNSGVLVHIPFGNDGKKARLGGTALAQVYGQIGNESPDMDDPPQFTAAFNITQQLIRERSILSGHDISDGGLLVCVLEMAFAGNCCLNVDISKTGDGNCVQAMFAEELGIVLEVDPVKLQLVLQSYNQHNIPATQIGMCHKGKQIVVCYGGEEVFKEETCKLRDLWEETSFQLETFQCCKPQIDMERESLLRGEEPTYDLLPLQEYFTQSEAIAPLHRELSLVASVAILREEGSNGDREMAAAFYQAGFQMWDITMQDLLDGKCSLKSFRGLAFVGGFSYADVLGSAKGWAASILFNSEVKRELDEFHARDDTFSLGVCNGCQLMSLLGWIGNIDESKSPSVTLGENDSTRFESRFSTVKIMKSPSIMLKDLQGCTLGVWISHGEGKFNMKEDQLQSLEEANLTCMRYVDSSGKATQNYPANPNGSPLGLAALCSGDGKHLGVMPHPERCFLQWQWPFWPQYWTTDKLESPWAAMFKSAYNWCSLPQSQ